MTQQINLGTINGENGGVGGGGGVESDPEHHHHDKKTDSNPSNFPVESFYLSKEEEIDWLNKNAFFERKESIKRKSISSSSTSTSQRVLSSISLKSKAASSIIGLPKTQKSCFVECKVRKNCKPSKARFFPKRFNRTSKSSVPPPSEPSSPKVSCIGRVRSKTERSRSLRIHHNNRCSTEETKKKNPKPDKIGFWSNFKAVLRIGGQKSQGGSVHVNEQRRREESPPPPLKKTEKCGRRTFSDPPVLGELKRFASGRKSESWGGGELSSDDDAAKLDSSSNR